jgi:CDP-glucose 4,6-dehydratase
LGFRPGTLESLGMNPLFWAGKKVLITGHTGFKGSWLALWLQQLGAEVIGIALEPPTTPSLFKLAQVAEGMQSFIADIKKLTSVQQIMQKTQPEIVFHLAAQALVKRSYADPIETYATNVMGSLHVLEAIRAAEGVHAVVMVTTDKCYENKEWPWGYRENDPMGGHDPYSSSKGCMELLVASYRNAYFAGNKTAIATARAGNVIGGGDWAEDRLIPDIIKSFQAHQEVNIRNPHAIRPWQHVLEPLAGYLQLAEKLYVHGADYAEAWNFGPNADSAKPVAWIVNNMATHWGEGARWKLDENEHVHEAHFLKLDCAKAQARLPWQPKWLLDYTLQKIVEWHKNALNDGDVRKMTLAHINEYQNTLI